MPFKALSKSVSTRGAIDSLILLAPVHVLFLGARDLVNCDLEHLHLALNVQDLVVLVIFRRWLHLCYDMALET